MLRLNSFFFFLIFVHVFFPLFIGCCIYLLFREDSILFFNWVEKINLYQILIKIRKFLNPDGLVFYNWMTQILPDALWCYSYNSLFFIILNKRIDFKNIYLFCIPLFIAITLEFCQYLSLINGTFDFYDIFAYILSVFLSSILLTKTINKNEKYSKI